MTGIRKLEFVARVFVFSLRKLKTNDKLFFLINRAVIVPAISDVSVRRIYYDHH